MGPLSQDGSLEQQDAVWTQNHRRQSAELFAACDSISAEVLAFLLNLHVHNKDGRQLLASGLLARSFQLHLAAIRTIEQGLESPSKVLLRAQPSSDRHERIWGGL